ncbi:TPA: hypothetical protein DCG35_03790 [Candidatus Edwardsbacteria bacterium]|nr:hypothetical protein [Candidatus Edwardsbacteria bacterium]
MPALFLKLLYSAAFALACAGAVVWSLERGDKKYRLGTTTFMDAFPSAAAVLLLVFLSSLFLLFTSLRAAVLYDLFLTAALLIFIWRKEAAYRARAKNKAD